MQSSLSLESVQAEMQNIKQLYPKSKLRYLHIRTIENFVFHLGQLKNDETRLTVLTAIHSFIEQAEKEIFFDAKTSFNSYKEYLAPLEEIYSRDVDFQVIVSNRYLLLMTLTFMVVFLF